MKILAGDWKPGAMVIVQKSFTGKWKALVMPAGWKSDKIPVGDIVSFSVVTEENKASIMGKVGWGAVGALALGPLGLLAGVLGGGNKRDRVMAIEVRDGRKALLKGNSQDVELLMAATYGNKPSALAEPTTSLPPQGKIEPTL